MCGAGFRGWGARRVAIERVRAGRRAAGWGRFPYPVFMLDYQTAGESHGPALLSIVTGVPAGLALDVGFINGELGRRQGGYGRGGRQRIETDVVEFREGRRGGRTIGSPLAMQIANRDSRMDERVQGLVHASHRAR